MPALQVHGPEFNPPVAKGLGSQQAVERSKNPGLHILVLSHSLPLIPQWPNTAVQPPLSSLFQAAKYIMFFLFMQTFTKSWRYRSLKFPVPQFLLFVPHKGVLAIP
jgi:hypothetical protein